MAKKLASGNVVGAVAATDPSSRYFNAKSDVGSPISTKNTAALNKLVSQTGGKIVNRDIKGKTVQAVEYQVKGPGTKSTRYAYADETPDMNPHAAVKRDPVTGQPIEDMGNGVTALEGGSLDKDSWSNTDPTSMNPPTDAKQSAFDTVPGTSVASPTALATQAMQGASTLPGADSSRFQQGYDAVKASGTAAPASMGEARAAMTQATPQKNEQQTLPQVEQMYATNPTLQQSMKEVQEFLSPATTTKALADSMKQVMRDKKEAAGLKFELMDVQRVMEGSDQDIRDEVEKAGGFATESQVQALTVSRNKSLLQRASVINNQLSYMQDVINSDMTMVGFQKDMAQQQFAERTFLLNYKTQNDQFIYKANQEAAKTQLSLLGADGLMAATGNDPVKIARVEKTLGLQPGQLGVASKKAEQDRALELQEKQMSIAASQASINASRASAASSAANTAKTWAEIKKMDATGDEKGTELKNSALQSAKQLIQSYDAGNTSAVGGGLLNRLGKIGDLVSRGTTRADFVTNYDNLKALMSLENVKFLKGQGQVSDAERRLLEDASARLSRNQSPEQFRIALGEIYSGLGGSSLSSPSVGSKTITYQGKNYSVDANGEMTPL